MTLAMLLVIYSVLLLRSCFLFSEHQFYIFQVVTPGISQEVVSNGKESGTRNIGKVSIRQSASSSSLGGWDRADRRVTKLHSFIQCPVVLKLLFCNLRSGPEIDSLACKYVV